MNEQELTDAIASSTGTRTIRGNETLDAVIAHISDSVPSGVGVQLIGFDSLPKASVSRAQMQPEKRRGD